MSATATVSPTRHISLDLPPCELRRHLNIQLGAAHMSACLSLPEYGRSPEQMLVYAADELSHCRLDIQRAGSCLWISSHAAFDLTLQETERVRAIFELHGLKVNAL
jgi:hypothetical protein